MEGEATPFHDPRKVRWIGWRMGRGYSSPAN